MAGEGQPSFLDFLSPFGAPAFACWAILFPPRDPAFLAVGLPDKERLDLDGVSAFRTSEMRLGWVPPLPRGRRCPRGRHSLTGRRLPLSSGQPLTPVSHAIPRLHVTRHHQGFTRVHPSSLPRAGGPQMAREPLGDIPELRTSPLPATHVKAGTGHRTQARNYTIVDPSDPSLGESTRTVRPRVARELRDR
jgi:hypothetical protein